MVREATIRGTIRTTIEDSAFFIQSPVLATRKEDENTIHVTFTVSWGGEHGQPEKTDFKDSFADAFPESFGDRQATIDRYRFKEIQRSYPYHATIQVFFDTAAAA